MNSPVLKILAGLAFIMVILASGAVILRSIAASDMPGVPAEEENTSTPVRPNPTEGRVINTSPPPVQLKGPVSVRPDNPLQPAYRPINQPAHLQFMRQEGKTYRNKVVGKVAGRASKKDWTLRGTAYFEYFYAVESKGKIIKNDGTVVVEERTFEHVHENLLVSAYEIGLEIPEGLDKVIGLLGNLGGPKVKAISLGASTALSIANNIQLPVKKEWVETARNLGIFTKVPTLDPAQLEQELRMFTQGTDNRLLEGKTVRVVFEDGHGVSKIEGVGCTISQREHDVIVRSNFVMDHYIMPDKKKAPDDEWEVNGDVFSGFLDPRLGGKVGGAVTILRTADFIDAKGEVSKRLKILEGNIEIRNTDGARDVTGKISGLRGVCVMPDKFGVVTAGHLHGLIDYRNLSKDHLLFASETTFTPKIQIKYECSVE